MEAHCSWKPPIPQPDQRSPQMTYMDAQGLLVPPGLDRCCGQGILLTPTPREHPLHTPQKTICKHGVNSPAVHLQGTPRRPPPTVRGTPSNDQRGPHTPSSSSDKVTSRGSTEAGPARGGSRQPDQGPSRVDRTRGQVRDGGAAIRERGRGIPEKRGAGRGAGAQGKRMRT